MSFGERLMADVRLPLERLTLAVNFETNACVIGVWGPSGSGKTTLVETLAGLRRNATGRIVCGTQVWLDTSTSQFLRPEHRHVGYVPQDSLLFPHLSVHGNLMAGARRARGRGSAGATLVERAVRILRIEALLRREVMTLSGGERQRVALARALCSAPALLLLDEPFASLDVPLRRELLPLIAQVREEAQVPMLIVSHDPTEIRILCDEVIALREGRVVQHGPPNDVVGASSPLAQSRAQDFENILRGTVVECMDGSARVQLGAPEAASGVLIDVPQRSSAPVGSRVFVGLSSRDILIAKGEVGRLSARNRLRATIMRVDHRGPISFVRVRLERLAEELSIEVTPKACAELALRTHDDITLIFKASACILYSVGSEFSSDALKA